MQVMPDRAAFHFAVMNVATRSSFTWGQLSNAMMDIGYGLKVIGDLLRRLGAISIEKFSYKWEDINVAMIEIGFGPRVIIALLEVLNREADRRVSHG